MSSQLHDLRAAFRTMQKVSKWDEATTIENFLAVLSALEITLVYPTPRNDDLSVNWGQLLMLEVENARDILYGVKYQE